MVILRENINQITLTKRVHVTIIYRNKNCLLDKLQKQNKSKIKLRKQRTHLKIKIVLISKIIPRNVFINCIIWLYNLHVNNINFILLVNILFCHFLRSHCKIGYKCSNHAKISMEHLFLLQIQRYIKEFEILNIKEHQMSSSITLNIWRGKSADVTPSNITVFKKRHLRSTWRC